MTIPLETPADWPVGFQQAMRDAVGSLLNVRVITTTGTYNKTPGASKALVEAIGGGGGGGGVKLGASTESAAAGGGGAGAYSMKFFSNIADIDGQTATIGEGGAGGDATGSVGGAGGTTSIGALITAPGGHNTEGVTSQNRHGGVDGNVGSSGVGDIAVPGEIGETGNVDDGIQWAVGGRGGSTKYGCGGAGLRVTGNNSVAGGAGRGYGAGGGGACAVNNTTGSAGGEGTDGVLVIYEYT